MATAVEIVDDDREGSLDRGAGPSGGGFGEWLDDDRVRKGLYAVAGVLAYYWVIQRFWPSPAGVIVQGLVIGGLTSLVAFGIALIYKANRIVNFAAGDIGALPASFAVLLMVAGPQLPYFAALPVGIVAGVAVGALIEFLLIRRFFTSPRLVLTVVTIGLAQLLAGLGFVLPQLFDIQTPPQDFDPPIDITLRLGKTVFSFHDIIAMVAVVVLITGLSAFLRYTNVGIAIRASAESADRASLLGVNVKRIELIVWVVAAVLATVGVFMRAGVLGLPFGELIGPSALVRALAAVVVGRMERLPTILVASLALGVVESSILFSTGRATLVDPILFVVIIAALLIQRRGRIARADESSSWQAANIVRPIPEELAHLPEVRFGALGLKGLLLAIAFGLPLVMNIAQVNLAAVILMTAIVGLSLVVLTGWAGQISLGQVAFVAIGAAVGSHLTTALNWDLSLALIGAGLAGAVAAMVVGIPALRIQGLYLAVATLAFALATVSYVLNREFLHWLPEGRFDRPLLFGKISVDSETRYYYLVLACLLLVLGAVRGLRNSRTGRVMIAVRENERGAQAFAVNAIVAKLTAFAFSGFLAAFAGGLFVHQQQVLGTQPYGVERSFQVFIEVVVGGLASPAGAILGVVVIEGANYFQTVFPESMRLFIDFFTGPVGLILVLLMMPGGLSQGLYTARDAMLRRIADRRGILVPSLVADKRQTAAEEDVAPPAEEVVAAGFEVAQPTMVEPVIDLSPAGAEPPRFTERPEPANGNGKRRRREPLRAGDVR